MKTRLVGTIAGVLCLGLTGPALADPSSPLPQSIPNVPSSVLNNPIVQSVMSAAGGLLQTVNGPTAHGKVTYFKRFDLQLETAPGVYRQVRLRQGTVINPRGGSIRNGMTVDVQGNPQADGSLNANSITLNQ